MIQRMSIRCSGCGVVFTLRLGLNVSKRAAFYVLCPTCALPIQGELNGNSIENVKLNIGGDRADLKQEAAVTTADLNAPVLVTADSMRGDFFGGMTNLTLSYLCDDRCADYIGVANRGIFFLEHKWPDVKRAIRYYLQSDSKRFSAAAKKADMILQGVGFETTHERASQLYTLVGATTTTLMDPSDGGAVFLHRFGLKHTAALQRVSYRTYARETLSVGNLLEVERRQLEELIHFIDQAESWRMGMLPRYIRSDVDLEDLDWRVLRDEFALLRDLYVQGFETVCRGLAPLVAAQNVIKRCDPNDFGDVLPEGVHKRKGLPPASVSKYEKLSNADKLAYVKAIPGIAYLETLMDRSLRNAIGHSSARHDLHTGRIVTDKLPKGISYLDFMGKVADIFEALALIAQVTRAMRIASSPDFS